MGEWEKQKEMRRFACWFASVLLGVFIFARPLKDLISMSIQSDLYSYIPLIFAVIGYLMVSRRKRIFDDPAYSLGYGALVLILSLAAGAAGLNNAALLGPNDYLCVMTLSFWLFLAGTFLVFFGVRALVKAIFPLAMLLFIIPLPQLVLDKITGFLQSTSFSATGLIFNTLGFFPLTQGFEFKFPELSVEVAKQCSGIHSSTVLVILSLLIGNLMLRSVLNRILLVFFAIVIAIFKNGVRIAGITLCTIYVDPRIIQGPIHKTGGVPVFILAFTMLSIIVLIMRKLEGRNRKK
jgi:exosortase